MPASELLLRFSLHTHTFSLYSQFASIPETNFFLIDLAVSTGMFLAASSTIGGQPAAVCNVVDPHHHYTVLTYLKTGASVHALAPCTDESHCGHWCRFRRFLS